MIFEISKIISLILILLLIIIIIVHYHLSALFSIQNLKKIDENFEYHNYQTFLINNKIIEKSGWLLTLNDAYFINGLIRKFRPKNVLEVGVARGGSSIIILNAIKDIKDSQLISLDLNTKLFIDNSKNTGYAVKEFFPELTNKWKLFTGDQPHKFLEQLNMKFDFLFLDTAHYTPGEIINLIEVLPFLNEGALVVLHDIIWHLNATENFKEVKFTPTQIYLMSSLYGQKIYISNSYQGYENIGAVKLYPNQEEHYKDYFLLLMSFWEEMPTRSQIKDLRKFIEKYYGKKIYLDIFDYAVEKNKEYIKNFKDKLINCLK